MTRITIYIVRLWKVINFELYPFCVGITIGEGVSLPKYNDTAYREALSTIDRYFPKASFDKYNFGTLKLSNVGDYLEAAIVYLGVGNGLDPIVIGRAFLVYTISAIFFSNAKCTIAIG